MGAGTGAQVLADGQMIGTGVARANWSSMCASMQPCLSSEDGACCDSFHSVYRALVGIIGDGAGAETRARAVGGPSTRPASRLPCSGSGSRGRIVAQELAQVREETRLRTHAPALLDAWSGSWQPWQPIHSAQTRCDALNLCHTASKLLPRGPRAATASPCTRAGGSTPTLASARAIAPPDPQSCVAPASKDHGVIASRPPGLGGLERLHKHDVT